MEPSVYKNVQEPSPGLYDKARDLTAAFLRRKCGFELIWEGDMPQEGPMVVLSSHQGKLDFLMAAAAFPNRRLHFVATEHYFRMGPLAALLHKLGVIPKVQFHPDPRCILSILRTIRHGGAVCIYPAGQTSTSGLPSSVDPSIVRLVKKSGAPVVAIRLHGGFFSMSRFASDKINYGRCEARVKTILTPGQMKDMPDEQIYQEICDAISFDEYAWQARTGATYRRRNRARGYQTVLYICPKCGARYTFGPGKRSRFTCGACGNQAYVGRDMRMTPVGDSVVYPTLTQWYQVQEQDARQRIVQPDFVMRSPVTPKLHDGKAFHKAGRGEIVMDRQGVRFTGELSGKQTELFARHETMPAMSGDTGRYFEIFYEDVGPIRYYPDNGNQVVEWKLVQELLHQAAKSNGPA